MQIWTLRKVMFRTAMVLALSSWAVASSTVAHAQTPQAQPASQTPGLTPEQQALQQIATAQDAQSSAMDTAAAASRSTRSTFGEYLTSLTNVVSLSGYGEVRLNKRTDDSPLLFEQHKFALVVTSNIRNWIFFETELEYEQQEGLGVEYAILDLQFRRWLLVRAGLMLVPFGQFNEIGHPSFRNRLALRPLVYEQTFPSTYSDAGVQVRGLFDIGPHVLGYVAYVVNGLRSPTGSDDGSIRDMRENTLEPNSSHKAFGGRIWAHLSLGPTTVTGGASIYTGVHAADPQRWLTIVGADLRFQWQAFELLSEWAAAVQERDGGKALRKNGAYFQLAYTLWNRIQPVVRFDLQYFPGKADDVWGIASGLNLLIIDNVIWKNNYYLRGNLKGGDHQVDEFVSELAFAF